MIVPDSGEDVRDLIPDDPSIRILVAPRRMRIGAKRNFCCQWARGEIILHWDDDDWSAPERMAEQVAQIGGAVAVTGYRSLLFWDECRHQAYHYHGAPAYALGTSFCYRRAWWFTHPFADLAIGEDNGFIARARAHAVIAEGGDRMVARIHGGSTSPKQTSKVKQWQPLAVSDLPGRFKEMSCL